MNWVDRTIGYINPSAGLRRASNRARFDAVSKRAYEAATYGRRGKSFKNANSTGPNLEIAQALTTLRNRSRHFVRNNGWAKRALTCICDNVVGSGIRPAPSGTKNQVKKVKSLWAEWAETTRCDYDGKMTFYGIQELAISELAESGDCIIVRRRRKPTADNSFPIQLQVLSGDYIDHTRDTINEFGYARLGIQFDFEGRRIGYWLLKSHPSDMTGPWLALQSELVSIDDVIHPYEILRAGQVRGVPMGVAAFIKMSDFNDYEDAQLVRQKAAASFCAFVSGRDATEGDALLETLEPGIIEYLDANEAITFSNPPAADGYGEYSKKILQGIASAYGITYEMLTMDYSNVNFTSGRMAKIDVSKRFQKWQYLMFVPQVCVPVWRWFIDAAIMAGLTSTVIECNARDWTAPRVQQLDPTKETNARIAQISAGLTTWSEVVREDGRDPEEFLDEYKKDIENLKEAGVNFSSVILAPVETNNNTDKND